VAFPYFKCTETFTALVILVECADLHKRLGLICIRMADGLTCAYHIFALMYLQGCNFCCSRSASADACLPLSALRHRCTQPDRTAGLQELAMWLRYSDCHLGFLPGPQASLSLSTSFFLAHTASFSSPLLLPSSAPTLHPFSPLLLPASSYTFLSSLSLSPPLPLPPYIDPQV